MTSLILKEPEEPLDIPRSFIDIIGTEDCTVLRYFDNCVYDEGKGYNTYKITAGERAFALKKYAHPEDLEAEVKQYALLAGMPVPKLLGVANDCILMDHVEGDDLKNATDDGILAAAESLAEVMNAYPMGYGYEKERYEVYLRRLEKRAKCLTDEPALAKVFGVFFERQKSIPLTLSNADLLPINVLYDGKKSTIIDWEFGGFLPYSLDIARFVTHGTYNGEVSSFRMEVCQKKLFIDSVYDLLKVKPAREVYERDLLLAMFNECIEILEYYLFDPSVERSRVFSHYYDLAKSLAESITLEDSQR